MDEKPNYYAVIPANVRYDKRLKPNEKLMYGELSALCNKTGECWASNSYFAELYGVTTKAISTWIQSLAGYGYIETDLQYSGREITGRRIKLLYLWNKTSIPMEEKVKDNNISINNINNNINNNNIVDEYEKEIGLLTPYQYERLITYTVDLSQEMIIEAIHIASRMNKKNLAYVEAILKNWIQNGYKVIGDIKNNKPIKEIKKFENDIKSESLNDLYDN